MKKRIARKRVAVLLSLSLLVHLIPKINIALALDLPDAEISNTVTVEQLTANSQILNYVDEAVLASNNHVRRLEEDETLSSYVFLNRDGTKTVYYTYEEVKYQTVDGTVVEKNISLINTTNGYTTTSNDVGVTLPNDPAAGVGISYLGYEITLTPQDGALRAPAQNSGTSVCYPDYFGEGTILVYTPTLSGVKEDVVLAHYTGINTFSFQLETDGLTLYTEDERYYLAESEEAEMRIAMGDIVSFDACGKFSIGTLDVQTVAAGEEYVLTLTVDEDFLADENTVYPVSIDPTLTVSDNTHGAGAIEDVTIYSGRPNVNGNWTYLHCGYYDATYKVARTLVRLTGLYNDYIYRETAPADILSAEFHIREATGTAGQTINLYLNGGSIDWTESGATWANAGAVPTGSAIASASPSYDNDAVFNILNLLRTWKIQPINYTYAGFVLKSTNETSIDKAFYSSEYSTTSYRPYVVVTYAESSGMLPTSGHEKDFDLDLWTGPLNCIELLCNCYGYALNNQIHPDYNNSIWCGQQMGYYSVTCHSHDNEEVIFSAIEADYSKYREKFNKPETFAIYRIGQYATCPPGMYKVALATTVTGDEYYHWYRQDSDGKWSHKNMGDPAKRVDDSGEPILDPWTADRGNYVNFLGYYAVYPWDGLHDAGNIYCYLSPEQTSLTLEQALFVMYGIPPT